MNVLDIHVIMGCSSVCCSLYSAKAVRGVWLVLLKPSDSELGEAHIRTGRAKNLWTGENQPVYLEHRSCQKSQARQ